MDKLQQAIQEELANRLHNGKIKSSKDLSDLFHEMYRLGIQEMLKAEMDEHLGYEKHAPEGVEHTNSRNGYSKKKVKSNLGEVPLEVPRDREGSFEPQLVPSEAVSWPKLRTICYLFILME